MKLFYLILSALLFTANAQETGTTGQPTTGPPATTPDAAVTTQSTLAPPSPTTGAPTTGSPPDSPTTALPTSGPPTSGPTSASSAPTVPNTASPAPTVPTTASPAPPGPTPFVTKDNLTTYHYNINGTDDNYCIMISVAMQFNLSYIMKDKTLNYAIFDLENAVATGNCSSDSVQYAYLVWGDSQEFNLTFTFKQHSDDKDFGLSTMVLKYSLKNDTMFPNADISADPRYLKTSELDKDQGSDYRIDMGGSYLCNDKFGVHFWYESVNGTNYTESSPTLLEVQIDNFKYQAFADKGVTKFGTYTECSSDFGTSDVVPIAVGCALAALVVIVLIAYLIGRRRSRQKGYQSV